MVEYFDIIDNQGNLTGETVERDIAHRDGIRHRAVHIWIYTDNKQILIQQRSFGKDSNAGKWDISCAGHLSAGETVDEALEKELEEELGLQNQTPKFVFTRDATNSNPQMKNNELDYVYMLKVPEDTSFQFQDGEVEQVKWVSTDELEEEVKKEPEKFVAHGEYWLEICKKVREL